MASLSGKELHLRVALTRLLAPTDARAVTDLAHLEVTGEPARDPETAADEAQGDIETTTFVTMTARARTARLPSGTETV